MLLRRIWPALLAVAVGLLCSPSLATEFLPIHVTVSAKAVPLLGQTGEVTATVTADRDLPNVSVAIELPTGGKIIAAPASVLGSISGGVPIDYSAKIAFDTPGNKLVRAVVRSQEGPGMGWSDVAYLGMNIGAQRSTLGLAETGEPAAAVKAPGSGVPTNQPVPRPAGDPSAPRPAAIDGGGSEGVAAPKAASGPVALGTVTVSGSWHFNDRDGVYTPMRDLVVELCRADNGAHLAWAWTNWDGNYTFPAVTNPNPVGVYVVASTWTDYGGGNFLSVITLGGDEWTNRYTVATGSKVLGDGAQSMGDWYIVDTWAPRKAWWIKDDQVKAYWVPGGSYHSGRHVVEWDPTSTHGSHYHPGGNIHLMGGDADDTPDRVLHEMGHSVMYNIYGNYMPPFPNCNPHYINLVSSAGCAWDEGWAHFWALWCTNDPVRHFPGGSGVDLEVPTWGTPDWDNGDQVEGRVSGALWDIYDSTNDGYDTWTDSWPDIWDVMWNVNCDNFVQFWNQWKARGHWKHGAVKCIYQNTIDYNTWPSFSGLPDVTTNEDTPVNNAVDLWLYASDAESADSELTYTIIGNTNPSCGATIDAWDYLDVSPSPNWWGSSTVTISCSDGIRTVSDSLVVTINSVNDQPIISGLPDQLLAKNTSHNNAIDLWVYSSDVETPDWNLTYAIVGNTNPSCGASIDAGDYLDIFPTAGWTGNSYVTVRVTDPEGAYSEDTFEIVVANRCATCTDARKIPNNGWVWVDPKTVTATFPGFFYMEDDTTRASGMRVAYGSPPARNRSVEVAGQMGPGPYSGAERQINCHILIDHGVDATPPGPLGMTNRAFGGVPSDPYTAVVPTGRTGGLYNVGLLTRTTGKVTATFAPQWFWVDDGSHLPYGGSWIGLLVYWGYAGTPLPPVNARVSMTGLSTAGYAGSDTRSIFLPRLVTDVRGLGGRVAYIYSSDDGTAKAFGSTLSSRKWKMTPITLGNLPSRDLSVYDLIIISEDSGTWTTPSLVAQIVNSGKPVIAVGTGGGHFLDAVGGLHIGWLPSAYGTTALGYVDNPGLGVYFFDVPISIPEDNILTMLTAAVRTLEVYNPPTSVVKVLRTQEYTTYWTVANEGRYMQWGYTASPSSWTATAADLFVNCIYYMQGQ